MKTLTFYYCSAPVDGILEAERRIKRLTSMTNARPCGGGYTRRATVSSISIAARLADGSKCSYLSQKTCLPVKHSSRTLNNADALSLRIEERATASNRIASPANEQPQSSLPAQRRSSPIISITMTTIAFLLRTGWTVESWRTESTTYSPRGWLVWPTIPDLIGEDGVRG